MGDYRVCCLGAETGIPSESLDCIENRSTLTLTSVADPTSIREIEPPRVILTGATVAVDEVIEELVQRGVFDPVVALVDGRSIADVDADDAARVRTARNCPEAVVDRIEAAAERASDRDMPTQHQLDRFEVALAAMGSGLDGLVDSDSTDNLVETLCSRLCGPEAYDAAAYYEYQIELESVELHSMVNTGSVDVDDLFRAPSTTQAALESISTDQSLSLFDSTDEGTNGTVALIPIVYQEIPYGVIAVYADCPAAFGALERRLLAIFGDAIANGIVSLQRKRAITHDDSVELEIALEGPDQIGRASCRERV